MRDQTDRKISWVREAAGARLDDIEIQMRFFITKVTDDRMKLATAMALFSFKQINYPIRYDMLFERHGGQWQVDDVPQIFQATKRKRRSNRTPYSSRMSAGK